MKDLAILLWPLLGFLCVASLFNWWQAWAARLDRRRATSDTAREEIQNLRLSREKRAVFYSLLALAVLIWLSLFDLAG